MTAQEYIDAYHRFSQLAEQHFDNGDDRVGSELLYGALTQIIIAIAIRRRERFEEHQHRRHVIRMLANDLQMPELTREFRAAQRLHVHFYLNNLAPTNLVVDLLMRERITKHNPLR